MKNKIIAFLLFVVSTQTVLYAQENNYVAGKKNGVWNYYSYSKNTPNKVLLARHFYNSGIKTGIWEFYTIQGTLSWTYNFNNSTANYILQNTADGYYAYQGADGKWIKKRPDSKTIWLGSESQWNNFLVNNLKYHEESVPARVPGKVQIMVYVDEQGNAYDYKVKSDIEADMDKEALRVARLFNPEFVAAVSNGQKVKSIYILNVSYKLADSR
jgi:hypothetical protein